MGARRSSILLTLIRRGRTTWEAEGRLHGATDLPLSQAGREEVAEEVAQRFQWDALPMIFHPPDEASSETARIVADHCGSRTRAAPELVDMDLGLLEGLTTQAFADRFPKRYKRWLEDPLSLSPPEGEPASEAWARILSACGRLLRRFRGDQVGIVLPSMGLGFLRCWLAERPAADLWSVLENRPAVECYLLSQEAVGRLENEARLALLRS